MKEELLLMFAKTLAGNYSNREQAQNKPKDFAHINIYFQPIDWSILNAPGFYSEQSFDYDPWSPYRQAIHKIKSYEDTFILENFQHTQPQKIAGSGFQPELLKSLCMKELIAREGCAMYFKQIKEKHYIGEVESGQNCLIPRADKLTYLKSQVEFNESSWKSLDEGLDSVTHQKVWGSVNGPIYCKKIVSHANQIDQRWLKGVAF